MSLQINPDNFRVPYAISESAQIFHVKYGRPENEVSCPVCRGRVFFVSESDGRAAHFRHKDKSDCDAKALSLRGTIHDSVRDATVEMLNGRYTARDICKGSQNHKLPSGMAQAEQSVTIEGVTYRPDVTVSPAPNQDAVTLELEVVWSSKPTEKRLLTAANAGRVIGILDITGIERSYYRKLWASQRFDIPEACRAFVAEKKYTVQTNTELTRLIRGVMERRYQLATVRREHAERERLARMQSRDTWVKPEPVIAPAYTPPPTPPPIVQKCGTADEIISALDAADSADAVGKVMQEYSGAIAKIAAQSHPLDAVRAIHIRNLRDYKIKQMGGRHYG